MCYTCGCKLPYEDHGDPANLVEEHLRKSGETGAIEGAGVTTAKQNMLELIELQMQAGETDRPKEDYND